MEAVAISVSTCTAPALHGQHSFMVFDYSMNKALGLGEFIRSNTFNVGGFDWSIRYYPDGANSRSKEYISVFLELMTQGAQVRAMFSFRILVGQSQPTEWTTGQTCLINQEDSKRCTYGWEKFIERTTLEASVELLVLNRIVIDCRIVVPKERPLVSGVDVYHVTMIPPSELSTDFGKLLESKEGADITFLVKGEAFPAHKMVLVARSQVFKAFLCSPTMENGTSHITVEDMEPDVFEALLQFIYTDSLMPLDSFDYRSANELIRHLLRAADRYGMARLKNICEMKLCTTIDVERVIITLLLAHQHQCDMLKHACLNFLATPSTLEKVMETADYNELKSLCPSLLVEFLESALCMIPTM